MTPDQSLGITGLIVIALAAVILLKIYFMPYAIAAARSHPNRASILIVNTALGWTFVGWVACLAWAYSGHIPDAIDDEMKTCPRCAENVKSAAKVCRYCGHEFS